MMNELRSEYVQKGVEHSDGFFKRMYAKNPKSKADDIAVDLWLELADLGLNEKERVECIKIYYTNRKEDLDEYKRRFNESKGQ